MRQKLTRHVVNVAHTAGDATTPIQRTSNRSRQGVPFLSEDSHGIFIDMLWWARSHQHVSEKCETLLNIAKHPPNRKISTETPDVDTELCRGVVVTATLTIFEILNCNGILNAWSSKGMTKLPRFGAAKIVLRICEQCEFCEFDLVICSYCWCLKFCTTERSIETL